MKTPLLFLLSLAAVSAAAAPKILSPEPEWNAGEARIGTKLQHAFTIKNEGDQPLKINEVKPGCGCTTANLAKSELLPGESTTIEAALDLAMRRGMQNKTIHVKTNDPATPDYVLMIKVFSKDDFKLQPEYIDLGPVTTGVEIQRTATLSITSEKAWKITEIASTKKLATATYAASADGKEYTITVTVPPQTAIGTFFDNLQIRTDNPDTQVLPLQVVGTVQAGLTVGPEILQLEPGAAAVSRTIVVRGGSIKTFQVLGATLDAPGVTVEVLPVTVFGQQIRLRNLVPSPDLDGKVLVIKTDAKGYEEIRVPVKVGVPAAPGAPAAAAVATPAPAR